ncbi:hypothetical protein BKA69DRAFT_1056698 [Paraphysoderma sedebokerense]|nr:hypothetical protein BKA69DRAFT_1056698 [Paraphysoderma sedebokerense]
MGPQNLTTSTVYPEPVPTTLQWILPNSSIALNLVYAIITIISSLMSSLVIITLFRHRQILTTSHLSLINVVLCDLFFGLFPVIIVLNHAINHEIDMAWCQFDGFINIAFAGTSLLSLTVMSAERYFHIVRNKFLTAKQIIILLCCCWIWCLFFASFPFITQTYNVVQSSGIYCLGDATVDSFPTKFYGVICGGTVLFGMIFTATSYYLIYKKAIKDGFKWKLGSSSDVVKISSNGSNLANSKREQGQPIGINTAVLGEMEDGTAYKKQMKLTQKLALITLLFFIGWAPMGFNFFYQVFSGSQLPPFFDFACGFLGLSNGIFNSIVILTMDKRWEFKTFQHILCLFSKCFYPRQSLKQINELSESLAVMNKTKNISSEQMSNVQR